MHPQHWPGPPIARCPAWAARPSRSVKYIAIDLGDNVDARFADTFTHPLCAGGALEPYRCRRSVCRRFHAVSWLVHHHVGHRPLRSEKHTSELQSLMSTSYAVLSLKKQKQTTECTHASSHSATKN